MLLVLCLMFPSNYSIVTRLETRKKTRNTKPEIKDEKLLELQRKLDAKRAERQREQEQAKLQPSKKSAQRLRELNKTKVRVHKCIRGNWGLLVY